MQTYVSKRAVKDVHGAVVRVVLDVFHVVLHLHLDRVPVIVFTTLELLIPIFSAQSLRFAEKEEHLMAHIACMRVDQALSDKHNPVHVHEFSPLRTPTPT